MNIKVTVLCGRLTWHDKSTKKIDGLCLHLPVTNNESF